MKKCLEENNGIKLMFLPVATPRLNAVEEMWKDAKYRLSASGHYETLDDMNHTLTEYFRTFPFRFDIYTRLYSVA